MKTNHIAGSLLPVLTTPSSTLKKLLVNSKINKTMWRTEQSLNQYYNLFKQ